MWRKPPRGISIPYVDNAMSRNVVEFMRRDIPFSDNSRINKKGVRIYNPLFKVFYMLQIIMKGMRGVWTSRKHVTIDKSMIKYKGKTITCPVHAWETNQAWYQGVCHFLCSFYNIYGFQGLCWRV